MFTSSARYSTLTQQVARDLEDEIRRGVLRESLPGERRLAEVMQVSRRTIRGATEILRAKKLVRTVHGKPTRILAVSRAERPETLRKAGLLLPKSIDRLKPFTEVIEGLQTFFYSNGFRLEMHFGEPYLGPRPVAALKRLVTRFPYDGWILNSATRACQAWFQEQGIAAVVSGTTHEGISLPSVDSDMQATARHAATLLLRKGHRRIALLMEDADWAGHIRTEKGFLEGAQLFGEGAVARVHRHLAHVESMQRLLRRILDKPDSPTGFFIVNPFHYLAISAILAERGLKVPRDISLICRDDHVCLRYLPVRPSRYSANVPQQSKLLYSLFTASIQAGPGQRPTKTFRIPPEYVEGDSVGPPP